METGPASPRPLWHPLARSVLYMVAYAAVQLAVVLLFSLLDWALGGVLSAEGGLAGSNEAFLLATVLAAPPMLLATWLFVRYLDRRGLGSIGIRWPEGGRGKAALQVLTTALAVAALLGVWLALTAALAEVRFEGLSKPFREPSPGWPLPQVLFLALLLLGFLVQGGLEELVVRGYIYRALKERWRPWLAALSSSLLFSLLHATNPSVSWVALVNIVLAGLVLAAMVERSGSLWSATVAHGFWNWGVACALSLPVSGIRIFRLFDLSIAGDDRVTGGGFGPEGSLVLTTLGLLLALALWAPLWRRSPTGPLPPRKTAPAALPAEDAPPTQPSAPEDDPGPSLL
ncbi:MAG TPA: type II CAAX endopeptidase family protein [Thermoanaerobaculia bacterium]